MDDLQKAFKAFMSSHQFRHRNEMSPCGVTVTQCYTLDALGDCGRLTASIMSTLKPGKRVAQIFNRAGVWPSWERCSWVW